MSSASGAQYGPRGRDSGGGDWAGPAWRGPWEWAERQGWRDMEWRGMGWRGLGWRPFELIAMVLGFMVFWPIGLAVLGWKMCGRHWQRHEFAGSAAERWRSAASRFDRGPRHARGERWRAFDTGNTAFDDWKAAEIDRLEEERRRLDEAHREFAEFLYTLRQARDREEFERFMTRRRGGPNSEPPASGEPDRPAA